MNPSGNSILITGASAGIGRSLAIEFHKAGNSVIAAGRNEAALASLASDYLGIEPMPLDVTDPAAIRDCANRITQIHPELNVLVNNAGIMRYEAMEGLAASEAMIETNLLGAVRLTSALLPLLQGKPGATIINVSSTQAFVPLPFSPIYCATKAALHAWTFGLRLQLAEAGIDVIEIIPPAVQTELTPGQSTSEYAMPLDAFISETMALLRYSPPLSEICVEQARSWREVTDDAKVAGIMQQFGVILN